MLRRLRLKNFQCHQDLTVELDRITVLVGANGSGKGALLRAAKWWALNDWLDRKDTFITWGEARAEVVGTTDEHTVKRRKGGAANAYVLDGRRMRAGSGVPLPVVDALGFSEDNFQDQDDAPYWLNLTGGQAAAALNEIFGLGEVDATLANIGAEVREAKARVRLTRERLAQARKDKKALAWVPAAHEQLTTLEEIVERLQEVTAEQQILAEQAARLEAAEELKRTAAAKLGHGTAALTLGHRLLRLDKEITKLRRILELEASSCELTKTLKEKEARLEALLEVCPLCKRRE